MMSSSLLKGGTACDLDTGFEQDTYFSTSAADIGPDTANACRSSPSKSFKFPSKYRPAFHNLFAKNLLFFSQRGERARRGGGNARCVNALFYVTVFILWLNELSTPVQLCQSVILPPVFVRKDSFTMEVRTRAWPEGKESGVVLHRENTNKRMIFKGRGGRGQHSWTAIRSLQQSQVMLTSLHLVLSCRTWGEEKIECPIS